MARNYQNFEEKLIAISGEEEFKGAKQLLKNNQLACAYRDQNNRICATFNTKSNVFNTRVITGDNAIGECDCKKHDNDGKLCEHSVAAIMYASKFNSKFKAVDEEESRYPGLKSQNFSDFLKSGSTVPDEKRSFLRLTVNSEFPHVPSKWEHAVLSVKLCCSNREYLGNQSNLRHLYFDKMLSVAVRLENFSLRDQQIIRYLAINGEPDGSNILLDSEQTAEFFHCLVNFDNFRRDGRKLIIHGEYAEPVIISNSEKGKTVFSPAIRVNGALLDLSNAKVITGSSGCWVGKHGEYYFVAATLDVSWIRSFFRFGRQELNGKLPDSMTFDGQFAVPVIHTKLSAPDLLKHNIMLDCRFDAHTSRFALSVNIYIITPLSPPTPDGWHR